MELLFVLRLNQKDKVKPATVYCRITYGGVRAGDLSTFIKVKPDDWHSKGQCIIADTDEAKEDNERLQAIRTELKAIYNRLYREKKPITAHILKAEFLHEGAPTISFLEAYREMMEHLGKKSRADNTIASYRAKYKKTEAFLASINRLHLIPLEFTIPLADDFELWLRAQRHKGKPFCHNHIMKHLKLVKQVLRHAARRGYILQSPLQYLTLSLEKPRDLVFLSDMELRTLESYTFASESLQRVADAFLFQCYTGFNYCDYASFRLDEHIREGEGGQWIYKPRQKTDETAILPFFSKARNLLQKYGGSLPVISNQKSNKYIKEVAEIVGIKKHLTMKVARKTAANLWLNNGVPPETVARMLGQSDVKTLMRFYATVSEGKIARDVKVLG